jgi:penicillin-binding protein 1C
MKFLKKHKIALSIGVVLITFYCLILPSNLFDEPFCTVLKDHNGELLGAHIAKDGQYRFPEADSIPQKFEKAIISFEDKRFKYHWGVDILSIARAIKQNIQAGEVVSGGSTITMQVIRLSRKGKKRTIWEKIVEIVLATRLEFSYSKSEILNMYASHAPFGGNVVGIDAASWRYFGLSSDKLSWAQSATLAVLPNSPSLIHPGKNREILKQKRDKLLEKMYLQEIIDKETYYLSLDEEIPTVDKAFPNEAHHLLFRKVKDDFIHSNSTIDGAIQKKINKISKKHNERLSANNISNLAILVLEVETNEVKAYVGNVKDSRNKDNNYSVDLIMAERSTGSILKPFLYAAMLTDGYVLPNTLVYDIPTRIGGYTPKNYNRSYSGAVPAQEALARSLNIPAVRMLRSYGLEKFYYKLEDIGMTSLDYHPDHYGLSLILGGCEGSLWEVSCIYASMARTLLNYEKLGFQYNKNDYAEAHYLENRKTVAQNDPSLGQTENSSFFSASAIYCTFEAMLDVERPESESNWELFRSSEKIAWKTGTSFGFRDAWAIGVTPKYVVGVWAGNADGEGRPGLVGIKAAAPILFDVFNVLPDAENWFQIPLNDMVKADICCESGYLAGPACDNHIHQYIPNTGMRSDPCPFHKLIHLDKSREFQVHADCESTENIITESWFVLPPAVEKYYKSLHASYRILPPMRNDCMDSNISDSKGMELIYPFFDTKIFIPKELSGKLGKTVFEAAHRNKDIKIFWYIDKKLVGTTQGIHQIEIAPSEGEHVLTLLDENGEKIIRTFEVYGRNN